jgi:glutathione peroxidase
MLAKIDVNGPSAHPLYAFLKKEQKGFWAPRASSGTSPSSWSAVRRSRRAVRPYTPEDLKVAVEALL